MLNDAQVTISNTYPPVRASSPGALLPPPRPRAEVAPARDGGVKSATRALEIMELFTVHREALSVSEIAEALEIPQSSSSVLLQAMKEAGFIDRDRRTRKYVPSIRSVFLGNWIHDTLFRHGSLLQALDALSDATGANVRLGLINGIHVRYAHVAWPGAHPDRMRLRPGMLMPICHDALGRMLLASLGESEARGIVRRANAADGLPPVGLEDFMAGLSLCRDAGFVECADLATPEECVLAVQLPAPFGVPAAIGLGLDARRLKSERADLLDALRAIVRDAWTPQRMPIHAIPDCD